MEIAIAREAELQKDGCVSPDELDDAGLELAELSEVISHSAVSAVVFAGMAAEAYIYDYAARHLGVCYTDKHVDKLSIENKWVVITQLVTGKKFPKGGRAFSLLKQLIKARNALVHSKSRYAKESDLAPEKIESRRRDMLKSARDGIKALFLLADELEVMHPEELSLIHI